MTGSKWVLLRAAKSFSKYADCVVVLVILVVINSCFSVFCVSLIFSGVNLGASSQFSDFLDGLGPAQLVGRQTLATPAIGNILMILLSFFYYFSVFLFLL